MYRIGYGYDVHRLEAGRKFILGGVFITDEFGPVAHSDGDVLLHALCDALLGAAALGDIGQHFPDSASEFKGISSLELLRRVLLLIKDAGFRVVNSDATILLEAPKIMHRAMEMRESIARVLEITPQAVSIKATTSEHLGFIGRGEGVAAHCVVLLQLGQS